MNARDDSESPETDPAAEKAHSNAEAGTGEADSAGSESSEKATSKSTRGTGKRSRRDLKGYGYGHYLTSGAEIPTLRLADLVIVITLLILSNFYMLYSLYRLYSHMDDYSHGLVVPFIAGFAAWLIVKREKTELSPNWYGVPVFACGMIIQWLAFWYEVGLMAGGIASEYFTAIGLIIAVWGLFLSFFGLKAVTKFWFPLLYLLFLIPGLPGPMESRFTLFLRGMVTDASAWTIERLGYSVYHEANVLIMSSGVELGVADACSGIRSLWAMLAVSTAIGFFLRLRFWQVGLFTIIGVILALGQNILRVVLTAVLGTEVDMKWTSGAYHDGVGYFTFFVASLILVVFAKLMAPRKPVDVEAYGSYGTQATYGYSGKKYTDQEMDDADDSVVEFSADEAREEFFRVLSPLRLLVLIVLCLGLGWQFVLYQHYSVRNSYQAAIERKRQSLEDFPIEVGEFTQLYLSELNDQALNLLRPDESFFARYTSKSDRHFDVLLNFWKPVIGFNGYSWAFPHNPDICFAGAGWEIEEEIDGFPEGVLDEEEILIARVYRNKLDGERQVVIYWSNQPPTTNFLNDVIRKEHNYFDRFWDVLRSWEDPIGYSQFQYSVGVYALDEGNLEDTKRLAIELATELKAITADYGLVPLQRIARENLFQESDLAQPVSDDA